MTKLTTKQIERLAEFGAVVSRHCRNAMTGEQIRVSISAANLTGGHGGANEAIALEFMGLMAYENVADLCQFRLGKPGQHSWREVDWERAIRNFNGN